jgi:hypothetical protein
MLGKEMHELPAWRRDQILDLDKYFAEIPTKPWDASDKQTLALAGQMQRELLESFQVDLRKINVGDRALTLAYTLGEDAPSVRFSSFVTDSEYFIFIPFTAVLQFMNVYSRLLAGTNAMLELGLPARVRCSYSLTRHNQVEPYYRTLTTGPESIDPDHDPLKNEDVSSCWYFLIMSSMRFMYFHEFGHVIAGHNLDAIASNSMHRRRRELEADFRGSIEALEAISHEDYPEPVSSSRYFLWGFALAILFLLIERFTEDDSEMGLLVTSIEGIDPYPRGGLRGSLCSLALKIISAASYVREEEEEVESRILPRELAPHQYAIERGFESAYSAWEEIGWGVMSPASESELWEVLALFQGV